MVIFFSFCLSGGGGFGRISWQMDQMDIALQDQDQTGCCHQHHCGASGHTANRTTSHRMGIRVLAHYLSPGYDQEQRVSNIDCAKPKREEQQRSSQNRNAV